MTIFRSIVIDCRKKEVREIEADRRKQEGATRGKKEKQEGLFFIQQAYERFISIHPYKRLDDELDDERIHECPHTMG